MAGTPAGGKRAKTLLTEAGPVGIEVPRDRDGSFEPKIVAKRQSRLSGVDDLVISLSAKVFSGTRNVSAGSVVMSCMTGSLMNVGERRCRRWRWSPGSRGESVCCFDT
jgi:transposase-like protein